MSEATVIAQVTRSDGWWAVSVPEIPGLFTQARRLDQVEGLVRDAANLLGVSVDHVDVSPKLDSDLEEMLREVRQSRMEALEAQRASSDLTRRAVHTLRGLGHTVRDVAALVGLSPQRVSALCREVA